MRRRTDLLDGLRGDPESRLLPVVAADEWPHAAAGSERGGRRGRAAESSGDGAYPAGGTARCCSAGCDGRCVSADGLLDSEAQVDRAKPLGVRDFTVDNVLDRLRGVDSSDVDPEPVLRFLWALLLGSRAASSARKPPRSAPSSSILPRGSGVAPDREAVMAQRPIVSGADGFSRLSGSRLATERGGQQQRSHSARTGLTGSKPGHVVPSPPATAARANAYRALDAVAPNDAAMIASPESPALPARTRCY